MFSPLPSLGELTREDRDLLELMVVLHEATYVDALAAWHRGRERPAEKLGAAPEEDVAALRTCVQRLAERGLLTRSHHEQAPRVHRALQHALLEALRSEGRLAELVTFVRAHAPLEPGLSYWVSGPRLARDILHANYLDETTDVLASLRAAGVSTRSSTTTTDVLMEAYGPYPSLPALQRMGTTVSELYLSELLHRLSRSLEALPEAAVSYLLSTPGLSARLLAPAGQQLVYEGQLDAAAALVSTRDEPAALEVKALVALAGERHDEARSFAAQAFDRLRDKKGEFKGARSVLAPWCTLLLVTSKAAHESRLGTAQLELAEKGKIRGATDHLYDPLLMFAQYLKGERWSVHGVSEAAGFDGMLFFGLLARFAEALTPDVRMALAALAEKLQARGYHWIARAVRDVQAERVRPGSLCALYRAEAAWERALSALDGTAEELKLAQGKTRDSERLVFVLDVRDDGSFELTARVQTQLVRGFSAGRTISWKRLHEGSAELTYLDDADRRVLAHIALVKDGYYSSNSYVVSPQAAVALIGHPRVFAAGEARTQLEVLRGTPHIEAREHAGELTVLLVPAACARSHSDVVCAQDVPGTVLVYSLNEAQRKLAARLSDRGLKVPAEGVERAKSILGKLVDHFAVTSEVGVDAEHIEEVQADARLHVLLWRRGPGLRARVMVYPLGSGPSFVPGRGSVSVLGTVSRGAAPAQVRTTRDLDAENAELTFLLDACPTLAAADGEGREIVIGDMLSCLEAITELYRVRDRVRVLWPEGEPLQVLTEADMSQLHLSVSTRGDYLGAEGELAVNPELKLALHELLTRARAAAGRFLALDDGRFLALTDQLKKRLDGMLALSEVEHGEVKLHPMTALDLASWGGELGSFRGDEQVKTRLRQISEAQALEPQLPSQLDAELRPYQRDGFVWLSRLVHWRAGACLADDMGLGKTLQTLALLLSEAEKGPVLVVAPLSVCSNWLHEIARFAPSLRAHLFAASERERVLTELGPYDVLVTSYGLMQQEIERLEQRRFRVLVLDEAQAIKNTSALRTKAALRLQGDLRVALTGTPIENHLGELWSIMSFLNPGLLGSEKRFEERFLRPIERDGDRRAAALLRRLVKPFVLRRRKSDVLDDLPEKTVITQRIPPSDAERALFVALREQALKKLDGGKKTPENRMRILAEITRLRRAACHPNLVAPEAGVPSSKLAAFEEILEELREGGHRALVFSQFVDYLSIVRRRLEELGVSYRYLDGSTPLSERERAVQAFQAGDGEVFLISLKAGGFGLNLTAADYVIHLDPWWNPAVEDQASDRAHRIGQTRPVTIYRLVLEGTIEEKILGLHAHKRDLADQLLEGTGTSAPLSVDELLALLRDAGNGEPPLPELGAHRPLADA